MVLTTFAVNAADLRPLPISHTDDDGVVVWALDVSRFDRPSW
jgi:hypothetical protein